MSVLYPDVPVWIRISDAPPNKGNTGGDKTAGEKRKRSFPWTYKLLEAAAIAHQEEGSTWQAIADQLEIITGRPIGEDAVANRVLRFIEDEE